jgi:F-type H+-transporting ATPase subunit a
MQHPILFLNKILDILGIHYPHAITDAHSFGDFLLLPHVLYAWFYMAILLVLGYLATRAIKMVPSGGQNVWEALIGGLEDFMVSIVGEEGRFCFPMIGTIFFFILLCNLSGIVPGLYPPTANPNTNLAMALSVFVYTHYIGVRFWGVKYIKHFMGPLWWLAPIVFPIEIIGHLARVASLTIRLFGNIFGHELVSGILFFLAGAYLAPLPILAMGIFVSFVQAFIFALLSMMYFAASIEHAH